MIGARGYRRLALGCALLTACTGAYLFDERRDPLVAADRTVALEGSFCTLGANDVVRPIKILLAFDASQSMRVTDPDGTRARAVLELLENLPRDPEVYVSVMVFAGSTTAFLTRSNLPEFEQVLSFTDADRLALVERLLNFTNPDVNRDSTDFVKPLADIYAMLNRDIAATRLVQSGAGVETRAKYSVVFLSDGHPTNDQDDELLCGDAVTRIRQLKELAEDVRVHTVHVFNPVQPVSTACDLSSFVPATGPSCKFPLIPPGACPMLLVNQDAERLERMAVLGGGDFRDFRNNEPINFLSFRFGQVRRTFELQEWVATNFSVPAGSPLEQADTDGDGLLDVDEPGEGTDPFEKDTDKDGFSDGVEVHFARLGGTFQPDQVALPDGGGLDPGCPLALRGLDSDCDGLLDCDEQLIGTNSARPDSDEDGIPDGIEWQLRSQGSGKDLEEDPDNDGVLTGAELRMHQDPLSADVSKLTPTAYRYTLQRLPSADSEGRTCYRFRVDNVSLGPTLADTRDGGTGRGAGYNSLYLAVAQRPADDPQGRTHVQWFRTDAVRFPVGGIRSPVDGVVPVPLEAWESQCNAADGGVP